MNNPNPHDPLPDHLHREALAERPAFSEERHQLLLTHLIAPKPTPATWFPRAAAALILTTTLIAAYTLSHHTPPTPIVHITPTSLPPLPIASSTPEIPLVTVNFANILSLNVWPPFINSVLTTPAPQPDFPPTPSPTPVDWLVDQLQQPSASANAALADLIPPNLRNLFSQSPLQSNDSALLTQ